MKRPVIGICASYERARFGAWDEIAAIMPHGYIDAVQHGGGLALVLPPDVSAQTDPDEFLDLLDGLVLSGGSDVDPAAYGAQPDPHTVGTVPERDAFEMALTRRALERDMPLLGICRGMQVLNVTQGGTLVQHVPDLVGSDDHRRNVGTFEGNAHQVRLTPGSLAARVAGEDRHRTLSHHHQAIDRLGEGLEITGWAEGDDLPEAVEMPDKRFVVAVQWHPEADEASQVVANFVAETAAATQRA